MTSAVLGLGGNVGDPRRLMAAAIDRLGRAAGISIDAVSSLYETPPWGVTEQPAFLNAAVRIDTALAPRALLDTILQVEAALGRQRAEKWGPRTIDIDILLFGTAEIDEPGLHLPHPHLHRRAFALAPLLDVAPDAAIRGRPAASWLAEADRAGMRRLAGPDWVQGG